MAKVRLVLSGVVLVLVFSACNGASDIDVDDDAGTTTSSTSDATSSDTLSTTTSTSVVEVDVVSPEDRWGEVWAMLFSGGGSTLLNSDLVATDIATVMGAMELGGSTSADLYPRVENTGVFPESGGVVSEVLLRDCVVLDARSPLHVEATMERGSAIDPWVVTTLTVLNNRGGCVPQELADEVIAAVEEFYAQEVLFWNPPDPDHPGIEATTTGEYKEFLIELLTSDRDAGNYGVLEGTVYNPLIKEVRSADLVVVADCYLPGDGYGYFDSSGNLLEDEPETLDGVASYSQPEMKREGGTWKVQLNGGSANDGCDPTSEADQLPIH